MTDLEDKEKIGFLKRLYQKLLELKKIAEESLQKFINNEELNKINEELSKYYILVFGKKYTDEQSILYDRARNHFLWATSIDLNKELREHYLREGDKLFKKIKRP